MASEYFIKRNPDALINAENMMYFAVTPSSTYFRTNIISKGTNKRPSYTAAFTTLFLTIVILLPNVHIPYK